jgi:hypothetical protein
MKAVMILSSLLLAQAVPIGHAQDNRYLGHHRDD